MAKQEGLGRGLGSLIPTLSQPEEAQIREILIGEISPNPNQPRKSFDQKPFKEMVLSIREFGVVQPVVVRPKKSGYELVAGERRWKAAKEAGLTKIPAVVRSSSDIESLEMALVENLQRENLNAIEEALAYRRLIEDFQVTQAELAPRLGKSRASIANTLRLLQLPEKVKQFIIQGNLSSGHARALIPLEREKQVKLADRTVKENLSVRQVESLVHRLRVKPISKRRKSFKPESFKETAQQLREYLATKVRVKGNTRGGKIEIDYKSLDDLQRICELIAAKKKRTRRGSK